MTDENTIVLDETPDTAESVSDIRESLDVDSVPAVWDPEDERSDDGA